MEKKGKIYTGITLDRDVAEFLAAMAAESRSSRSQLINEIIRTFLLKPGPLALLKLASALREQSP